MEVQQVSERKKHKWINILFPAGFCIGCVFAGAAQPLSIHVSESLLFAGPFIKQNDFLSVFSAFLFDSLFYAALIFLFGMTFLGIIVIPVVVLLKGFTLGISLSVLLHEEGVRRYFCLWLDYLPAAVLCVIVLLLLAGRFYGISRHCGQTLFKSAEPLHGKECVFCFFTAVFVFCLLSLLYSGLHFLTVRFLMI